MKTTSKRLANVELLRIIAMLMVVMLHYLGKGGLLPTITTGMGTTAYVAWILESLSIVAVNVYVLISGYFLVESEFKTGKIVKLVLQVLFYTILITVLSLAFGIISREDLGIYNLIVQLFPFQLEQYWFMTSYLVLYILSPILAMGVKALSKKNLEILMVVFLVFMCVEKSILPVQIVFDKRGYDALWFICLFLVAAYIRLYGIKFLEKKLWAAVFYLGGTMMTLVESMAIQGVYEKTGELEHLVGTTHHYNHLFVFLASVGLFMFFLQVKIKDGWFSRLVCKIAPYTLGVYLLHEHVYIRYLWPKWFGCEKVQGTVSLIISALTAVVVVFVVGIFVDFIRSFLFKAGSKLLYVKKSKDAI